MNDNARKWVEALRSGEYAQTRAGALRDSTGYCCLGVACDLYAKEHDDLKEIPFNSLFPGGYYSYAFVDSDGFQHVAFLPEVVRQWLGLRTASGKFFYDGVKDLAPMNDDGADFNEIANIIESEPKGLFE